MCSESSGKKPPASTSMTCPYCALMLSAKLARRARPPLGVCQPQGLVFPFTSVVERMISLPGSSTAAGLVVAAPASTSQQSAASAAEAERRMSQDFIERNSGERGKILGEERGQEYGPPRGGSRIEAHVLHTLDFGLRPFREGHSSRR